jgi:hypothetical protein
MKRRGFLGFLGGAAVAGPGMAKEMAAKAAMELSGTGMSTLGSYIGGGAVQEAGYAIQAPSFLERARASVQLLRGLTSDQRAELRRRVGDVRNLDPDLASYHSMSMGARIEIQRDRNVEAYLRSRKTWWQGVVDRGVEDWTPDPLDNL